MTAIPEGPPNWDEYIVQPSSVPIQTGPPDWEQYVPAQAAAAPVANPQTLPAPNLNNIVKVSLVGSYFQGLPNSWNVTLKLRPSGAVHLASPNGNITIPAPKFKLGGVKYAFPTPTFSQNSTVSCYSYLLATPPANLKECFRFNYSLFNSRYFDSSAIITVSGNLGGGVLFWRFANNNNATSLVESNNGKATAIPSQINQFTYGVGINWADMKAANPVWTAANLTLSVKTPNANFAYDPATIGTSTSSGAVGQAMQWDVWRVNGIEFGAYWDGTNEGWRCSSDGGATWSGFNSLSGVLTSGVSFGIYVASNTIYYIRVITAISVGYSSAAVTAGSCSINFAAETTFAPSKNANGFSAAVTYDGTNVWTAFGSAGTDVLVYKGTTLEKDFGSLTGVNYVALIPTATSVTAAWQGTGDNKIYFADTTDGGATWTTPAASSNAYTTGGWGITHISDVVDFGACASGTAVYFGKFTVGGSVSGETSLASSLTNCGGTAISSDNSAKLAITYTKSTSEIDSITSADSGATWGSPVSAVTGETSIVVTSYSVQPYLVSSILDVLWVAGTASPYNIRFAQFTPAFTVTQPMEAVPRGSTAQQTITVTGCKSTTFAGDGASHSITGVSPSATCTLAVPAGSHWQKSGTTTQPFTSCASGTCTGVVFTYLSDTVVKTATKNCTFTATANPTCQFAANVPKNDTVAVGIETTVSTDSITSVTDSGSNTYAKIASFSLLTALGLNAVYCADVSTAGTLTITANSSAAITGAIILVDAADAAASCATTGSDSSVGFNAGSTTPSVGSYTPSQTGLELGFMNSGCQVLCTVSAANSFNLDNNANIGAALQASSGSIANAATATTTPFATLSVSSAWSMVSTTFIIFGQTEATVTVTATCTTDNGTPQPTLTLVGASVTPTSLTCNAVGASLTVDKSSTITAEVDSDGTTTRRRFSVGTLTTTTLSPASGSGTWTFTVYINLKETASYSITDVLGITSAPTLTYVANGATGQTLALTTSGQAVWMDSGKTWSTPTLLTGSTSSERGIAATGTSGTSAAGGTINPAYYHQFKITNTGALSITRTNNGTSAAVTSASFFFDATTSISVAATYTHSWSPTAASWVYDVTQASIGIQVLGDQAVSAITWVNSNAATPYLTFTTATSSHVQGYVATATALGFVSVFNNGVKNPSATFSSNILDETGASPHEWDFSTSGGGGGGPPAGGGGGGGGGGPIVIQLPPVNSTLPATISPAVNPPSTVGVGTEIIILLIGGAVFIQAGRVYVAKRRKLFREPAAKIRGAWRAPERTAERFWDRAWKRPKS